MLNVAQIRRLTLVSSVRERILDDLLIVLEHQRRVIAQLSEVLQGLEDMLLTLATRGRTAVVGCTDDIFGRRASVGLGEIVVHVLLQLRKLAVVILDDLWWEIVQDILL